MGSERLLQEFYMGLGCLAVGSVYDLCWRFRSFRLQVLVLGFRVGVLELLEGAGDLVSRS